MNKENPEIFFLDRYNHQMMTHLGPSQSPMEVAPQSADPKNFAHDQSIITRLIIP